LEPQSFIHKNLKKLISEIVSNELKKLSFIKTLSSYYELNSFGQKGDRGVINIPVIDDENLKWVFYQLLNVIDELLVNHIQTNDYMQPAHWGLKPSGLLGTFDIGFGNYYENFRENPDYVDVQDGEDHLPQVLKKLGIKAADFIGGQANGSAYDIGGNKILKITRDKSEAVNCQKLIGKNLNHIADVYMVKQFTMQNREFYIIVLEKLNTTKPFEQWYEQLVEIFNKSIDMHFDPMILKQMHKKHPEVSEFLRDMFVIGYEKTWDKWRDRLNTDGLINKYDWNDISEISQWVRGSVDNDNDLEDEPPHYVTDLLKSLVA
jgi:hypothetical protein